MEYPYDSLSMLVWVCQTWKVSTFLLSVASCPVNDVISYDDFAVCNVVIII
jgi:hypothetical protein